MMELDMTRAIFDAVGLPLRGMCEGKPVYMTPFSGKDAELAELVWGSLDKPVSECTKLRDYLGADSPEWAAYVETRNAPQRQERQRRYRDEADPLIMKALETAEWTKTVSADASRVILEIDEKAWIEWKARKEAIRTELPYNG